MAIPENRNEFIDYCLRKLGQPVIKVNVDSTQIQDRVDEALYMFFKHNYEAVETGYILYTPTTQDVQRGYTIMDEEIVGVTDIYTPSNTSNIFNVDFQMRMAEIFALSNTRIMAGVSYYYSLKMHMDLLDELFKPMKTFEFNTLSKKLMIAGGLQDTVNTDTILLLRVYKSLDPKFADDTGETPINVWKNKWLQDYTTELIRRQWAQNMSKYQNVQLLGGVMMNGEAMSQMAEANIEKLETELREQFELPALPIIA